MPERLECEVLQKARYINTLTITFTFLLSFAGSITYIVMHKFSLIFGVICMLWDKETWTGLNLMTKIGLLYEDNPKSTDIFYRLN